MKYSYDFNSDLQIASVKEDVDNGIRVLTLLQNVNQKQPSINAYLGARYSRSADSVKDIAQEVMHKGIDASARLESIFSGYGHKSVGDMAELFVCIENVPMILAMRSFYLNPTLAGQERSTRFQNFKDPNFVDMPEDIEVPKELVTSYYNILNSYIEKYEELLEKVKVRMSEYFKIDMEDKQQVSALNARAFDTARYLIPLGMRTSLGFIMSARNWSEYISRLLASRYTQERRLGKILLDLLNGNDILKNLGYIPEADGLIRYTDPNETRFNTAKEIQKLLLDTLEKKIVERNCKYKGEPDKDFDINKNEDSVYEMLVNYLLTLNPNMDIDEDELEDFLEKDELLEKVGEVVAKKHNQHNQVGNIAQSGSYCITGYADHGILKDLNRHRSFERFVPLWEDFTDVGKELDREKPYFLCNYLSINGFEDLKEEFDTFLKNKYVEIRNWYKEAKNGVGEDFANEYTKYLLPHAHSTRYRYFASIDDLMYTINLRVRPGGHIAYRSLVSKWASKLGDINPFFKTLFKKLMSVHPDSREEFLDRG